MYSDKDFQTFWFRYKTEGEPHGISINPKIRKQSQWQSQLQ